MCTDVYCAECADRHGFWNEEIAFKLKSDNAAGSKDVHIPGTQSDQKYASPPTFPVSSPRTQLTVLKYVQVHPPPCRRHCHQKPYFTPYYQREASTTHYKICPNTMKTGCHRQYLHHSIENLETQCGV